MSVDQLLALQLAGFEVKRSGADVTLSCKACGQRIGRDARIGLMTLIRAAMDHAPTCPGAAASL